MYTLPSSTQLQFPNIVKIGNKIELQQYRSDVTESLEELYAEKKDIVDELKDTRDEIDDLYKQRTNFFEASDDITNDVKKQIQVPTLNILNEG